MAKKERNCCKPIEDMDNSIRDFRISFTRVICTIAVVTLHTNGCFWAFSQTETYWKSANIIECVFYFAVPVFFMLTGVNLINYRKKYNTKVFFVNRFYKTVVPYIFWSLIGVVYNLLVHSINDVTFKDIIVGLLNGSDIVSIYWFFPSLFISYLAIPLFSAVEDVYKRRLFKYLIYAGFILNIFIPFIVRVYNYYANQELEWSYILIPVSGFLIYPLCGYLIYNNPLSSCITSWPVVSFISLAGLTIHIYGTYYLSMKSGHIESLYKGYTNFPCFVYSIGIFILLQKIGHLIQKNRSINKIINMIDGYSFSIYLLHWFVLDVMRRLPFINTYSIVWRLGGAYIITASVVIIVWIMRKIPVARHVVP